MILGVRAHDFGKLPVEELAGKIAEKGFRATQLALSKAISGLDTHPGKLNPGMAHTIEQAFSSCNIKIAVLGCYINPVHPDKAERTRQIERFKEHIRYCRDFGCSIVATETGSLNADFSFHPDNHGEFAFKMLSNSIKELVNEAEKFGVMVAVEGVEHYVANNPARIKRLLDETGSNNLQVIFDPVNLLSPANYENQDSIIKEAFELFGSRIVALHAKDFILENGKLVSVQAGQGLLNYRLVLSLLKKHKPMSYVLMENVKPDQIDSGIAYLKAVHDQANA